MKIIKNLIIMKKQGVFAAITTLLLRLGAVAEGAEGLFGD
jgi:hypothetical protein